MPGIGVAQRPGHFVIDPKKEGGELLGRRVGIEEFIQLGHYFCTGQIEARTQKARAEAGLDSGHQ